jgi:hypothetical protein
MFAHTLEAFLAGAVLGGVVVGLIYHNNQAVVNAALAKAQSDLAAAQKAALAVGAAATQVADAVKSV